MSGRARPISDPWPDVDGTPIPVGAPGRADPIRERSQLHCHPRPIPRWVLLQPPHRPRGGATGVMLVSVAEGWTVGHCANCGADLDPWASGRKGKLYCSEWCQQFAKDVRYFRQIARAGRTVEPDVLSALRMRHAHLMAGGYPATARRVPASVRAEVLSANGDMCAGCGSVPATQVDHISGSSGKRANLQGLCAQCNRLKAEANIVPLKPEREAIRAEFVLRVKALIPLRACDDDVTWDSGKRRDLRDRNQRWAIERISKNSETIE